MISVLFDRCLDLLNSGPSRVPLMCSARTVLALTESPHIHKALISVRHPASEDAVPARLVSRLAASPVFRPDHRSRLLRYSVDSNHIPLVKLKTYSLVLLSYHTCSDFQEHAANFFEKLAPACDAARQIPSGSPRRPLCAGCVMPRGRFVAARCGALSTPAEPASLCAGRYSSSGSMIFLILLTHLFSDSSLTCTTDTLYAPVE